MSGGVAAAYTGNGRRIADARVIETILVVGEVSGDREVLVGCLRDAGFAVIEAEGTRQALQRLADQRIALLVVDCGAEALPCQELLEDVRSRGGPPVPILCCADPERETRF